MSVLFKDYIINKKADIRYELYNGKMKISDIKDNNVLFHIYHYLIFDYKLYDLVGKVPPKIKKFLLQTEEEILKRMNKE